MRITNDVKFAFFQFALCTKQTLKLKKLIHNQTSRNDTFTLTFFRAGEPRKSMILLANAE